MITYELILNPNGWADILKIENGSCTYYDYETHEEAEQDMWSLRDFHRSNPDVVFIN